jgi:dienelactone hydrolase
MELMEGQSLRERLREKPLTQEEALDFARQACDALLAAHAKGILHRDIKPANLFVTTQGQIKMLDFGLAKLIGDAKESPAGADKGALPRTATRVTITYAGSVKGTLAYMSPEQARGEEMDMRSDIFSLGAVIYEMVTGRTPFHGETTEQLVDCLLQGSPVIPSRLNPVVMKDVERITLKALEKDPAARYQSVEELLADLNEAATGTRRNHRRKKLATAAGVAAALLALLASWWGVRSSNVRWARNEAIPRARLLADAGDTRAALALARQAERYLGKDTDIQKIYQIYGFPTNFYTSPPGAEVYLKDYLTPDAPWELVGTTPIERFPIDRIVLYRVKVTLPGYETQETACCGQKWDRPLVPSGASPAGMVYVKEGPDPQGITVPEFWIDKYEVTNRQYQEFVSAGGYRDEKFWKHPFVKSGHTIPFAQAMADFKDSTGRPGPASWNFGSFEKGKDDYPVNGVSWYEAEAYAAFAGKSLPTMHHWGRAAGTQWFSSMAQLSNFDKTGPAPVGTHQGISDYGAFDMAGNVREWTSTAVGERRYILGGGWTDSSAMCMNPDNQLPWDRSEINGFRCIRPKRSIPDSLLAPVPLSGLDRSKAKPVNDALFAAYRAMFTYDHGELKSASEVIEDTPAWREEKVSYAAGYGGERVVAHLFLPKNSKPPYQTVVYAPGLEAVYLGSSKYLELASVSFLMQGGRAVMCPIYKGTYERGIGPNPVLSGTVYRDLIVHWSMDLGRSLDYLQTRPDIDATRLAYYGMSFGGWIGPILTQGEPRIKTSVLASAGLSSDVPLPEVDEVNYLPRSHTPTLLIDGKDDFIIPVESNQKPFFRMLGTAPRDKRYVLLNSGHFPAPFSALVKEVTSWLDQYLGPVVL